MYPLVACLPHVQEYARQALLQMQQAALYQQLAAAQQMANGDAQYALLQQQQAAAAAAAAAAAGAQGNAGQFLVWVALHVEVRVQPMSAGRCPAQSWLTGMPQVR